ncbi:2OG-Fe(II) oxygenase [Sphingosinithalassobacter portus]|uniref:2OG-Fe(II) oxygenase n=1 Tax=Stakelama portus TaxID=2676234 RepID=UPI00137AC46A|nr:2OG-Fe(II) oxygenase [Sphingosinithalassobacter portus]
MPNAVRAPVNGLAMFAIPGFLDDAECDALIALIDLDVKPSTSLNAAKRKSRTSETCHLSSDDPLVTHVETRMNAMLGLPASHGETVQGQRYHPGQQFMLHNDYFAGGQIYSEAVASEGGQRTWTAMVYLNEPEAGGETRFPYAMIEGVPTRGTLLTWFNLTPQGLPNKLAHHQGCPVEAGVKHVLTKWYREREWQGSAASDALRT